MKKYLPTIFLLAAFVPVFTLSAQKIAEKGPIRPKILSNLNAEIVLGDPELASTVLIVQSDASRPEVSVATSCPSDRRTLFSRVSESGERWSAVSVRPRSGCDFVIASLTESGKTVSGSSLPLRISRRDVLFSELSDLSDDALFLYARNSKVASESILKSTPAALSGMLFPERLEAVRSFYRAYALDRRSKAAFGLSEARTNLRYLVPIEGKRLPDNFPYVPNASRPYRKDVTDGIHHGWDLLAPVGTPVRAVSEGVVVRIRSGFVWSDFDRIVKRPAGDEDRAKNLDVFRGNQVWLKTADGNVTFYSHLRDIDPGISEGASVTAGQTLGTVGVTGVPDKAYGNPHLHFEIQKNPHDGRGSGDQMTIMRWDYLGKGLTKAEVRKMAGNSFR